MITKKVDHSRGYTITSAVMLGICLALIFAVCLLSGCNKQLVDVNWRFTTATIDYGDHSETYSVKSWNDYENGDVVQIVDTDGHVHLTHYSNVVLEN